jgi:F0F1-type ATP synthase membrane subunit b/b'
MPDPSALMAEAAGRIVAGVNAHAAEWVEQQVTLILDAWGRLDTAARTDALARARSAGEAARDRVVRELEELFAQAPRDQRATPLQIIRTLRREPTEILAAAGVPAVVRDEYDERSFPDDIYGIVPKAITELGDEELGGALLAWGVGKSRVLRDTSNPGQTLEP